ncbi:hypothetical protein Tco_0315770 [Tanacetum coccineum]
MELCTILSERVLDLENTKTSLAAEITKLKERVKKLERRNKSRTPWLKILRKVGRSAQVVSFDDEGVFDEQEVEVEKVVSTTEVTTASATTTTVDELNLAQTLIEIKVAKPKAVTTASTTTTTAITRPKARGVVVQEPNEEIAQRLQEESQAKLEEEERLARQKEEEDNLISWDNTQDMMEENYELAQRLQAEEQGYQLKNKSFKEIQMLFDNNMKWVDSFVPMDSKVLEGSKSQAEGSKKRTREELESDNSNKQKIVENVEAKVDDEEEMKKLMEIVPDDELVEDSEEEDDEKDEEIEESMDSDSLSEDAKDKGPTTEDEDPTTKDEGLTVRVKGPGMDDESYGLDSESHGIDDESHGLDEEGHTPVVRTAVSAPLGLGYGALRCRELALGEDDVYNTFEVRRMPKEQLCGMPSVMCRERTMICGLQLAEERRARLELVEVLDDMRRGQEPKGDA